MLKIKKQTFLKEYTILERPYQKMHTMKAKKDLFISMSFTPKSSLEIILRLSYSH